MNSMNEIKFSINTQGLRGQLEELIRIVEGCNPSPADRNPTSIKGAGFAIHGLWIPASLPE